MASSSASTSGVLAAERSEAAAAVAEAGLLRTPLVPAPGLSSECGAEVRLKLECHQLTGSFKARGAVAAVARVPVEETVITASAGNHGIGVGFACRRLRRRARILVPAATDGAKVAALRGFGDEVAVEVVDGTYDDTEVAARVTAEKVGGRFVSSYNDPMVVAGQASVGSEALEQWPDADAILVPVGGGGLLAGVALACADAPSPVAAWGVEPEWSATMTASLAAGVVTRIPEERVSEAQGLVGNLDADTITFDLVRDRAAGVVTASEENMRRATARVYADLSTVVEVSGGAALCGIPAAVAAGARNVIVVLSGANISAVAHFAIVSRYPPGARTVPDAEGKMR